MLQKVLKRITDEQLAQLLSNSKEAQELFDKIEIKRSKEVAKKSRQFVNDAVEESTFYKNKKEVARLTNHIPALQKMIGELDDTDPEHKSYTHDLYNKTRRLEELQEDLKRNNAFNFLSDLVSYTNYEEQVETWDGIAERIGKWFEQGHIGPGTITFVGQTYTSNAS